jgi:hypothetical protein
VYVCGSGVYSRRSTGVPVLQVRIVRTYINFVYTYLYRGLPVRDQIDTMTAFLGILVRNHKYLEYNFFSNHFYDTNLHTT